MKDPDTISTIHLKLPFKDHINIKVEAMKAGKSMNQFIVDLLGSYKYVGGEFNAVHRPPTPKPVKESPNDTSATDKGYKFPPSAASML